MKLPRDLSGKELVKGLRRLGFDFVRQAGSHAILRRGGCTVVVPQHKTLKPGTLKGILEQAGLTVEELCKNI
jgi:predicted RNA binding protein YcfA (HicA-like mRNA interferase family)